MGMHYSVEDLEEYFRDQLSPEDEAAELEIHLAECEACARLARMVYQRAGLSAELSAARHGDAFWRERLPRETSAVLGAVRVSRSHGRAYCTEILSRLIPQAPVFPLLAFAQAIPTSGGAAPGHGILLGQPDGPQANVEVRQDRLRVVFANIPREGKPPMVRLVPAAGQKDSRTVAPRWDDLHDRWIAELEGTPEDYLIALVPCPESTPD